MALPQRGKPDDSIPSYLSAGALSDPGEIFARQIGIAFADNLGRTFLFDNFAKGLSRWERAQNGAALLPRLLQGNQSTLASAYCAQMTAGALVTDQSSIATGLLLGSSVRVGVEIGVLLHSLMPNTLFNIDYKPRDFAAGVLRCTIGRVGGTIEFVAGGTLVTTLSTPTAGNEYWAQVKIVGNYSVGKHTRLVLGERIYDTSAISLEPSSIADNGRCIVAVATYQSANPGYIGYVSVTRDEP